MFKIHRYPLPLEISNDNNVDNSLNECIPPKYTSMFEKLKNCQSLTSQKGPKSERKLSQRLSHILNPTVQDQESLSQVISLDPQDLYVSFGASSAASASAKTSALILTEDFKKEVEQFAPGDQIHQIKPKLGKKATKKLKKLEREKTKGDKWYGMPATEVTEEIKNDLEILKMRGALDPKRFYKKSSNTDIPKYFQVEILFRFSFRGSII